MEGEAGEWVGRRRQQRSIERMDDRQRNSLVLSLSLSLFFLPAARAFGHHGSAAAREEARLATGR